MILKVIDKDSYLVKVFNNQTNFDIYNHDEISKFVQDIFKNSLRKYNLSGNIIFNIFLDELYGMIIEIKKESDSFIKNLVDIKIKVNLNISFLYEIDYFYLIEKNIINQNIYYYNDKFYLEIVNYISQQDYLDLLDNSLIIYNCDINAVINNGIKLSTINRL